MENAFVYIVLSCTPNKMGKMIRKVTGEAYNHASIALDEDLSRMYSFARRYYETPLYGGFVKESLSRFHQEGQSSEIQIYKLPVPREKYVALEQLLEEMHRNSARYLYNHLSALTSVFHFRACAKDAYTCSEFCVDILKELGMDIDNKRSYSVCQIGKFLESYHIYTGPIPLGAPDEDFYAKKPVPHPFFTTLRDMGKLIPRLGK